MSIQKQLTIEIVKIYILSYYEDSIFLKAALIHLFI